MQFINKEAMGETLKNLGQVPKDSPHLMAPIQGKFYVFNEF